MAKSWKKFIPKTENNDTDGSSESLLPKIDFAKLIEQDDTLSALIKERSELENKIQNISQGTEKEQKDKRYFEAIKSFKEKKKEEKSWLQKKENAKLAAKLKNQNSGRPKTRTIKVIPEKSLKKAKPIDQKFEENRLKKTSEKKTTKKDLKPAQKTEVWERKHLKKRPDDFIKPKKKPSAPKAKKPIEDFKKLKPKIDNLETQFLNKIDKLKEKSKSKTTTNKKSPSIKSNWDKAKKNASKITDTWDAAKEKRKELLSLKKKFENYGSGSVDLNKASQSELRETFESNNKADDMDTFGNRKRTEKEPAAPKSKKQEEEKKLEEKREQQREKKLAEHKKERAEQRKAERRAEEKKELKKDKYS